MGKMKKEKKKQPHSKLQFITKDIGKEKILQ